MLNLLPYHLLKAIYQFLEPGDLSSMMAVSERELGFISKYRELFRKKDILLRLKGGTDHILVEVFAAEFSRKAPRRLKLLAEDIKNLRCFPGMTVRTVVVEGTSDSNNRLLLSALEKLETSPECSVTFKNVDFTGTDPGKTKKFLDKLNEIPLFRIKTCIFPSVEFATFLLRDSQLQKKIYIFEDDYSTILGPGTTQNSLGDELLYEFLAGKGEKTSFSLTENVTWQGITRFVEEWRRSPRDFKSVSFIRTAIFNDEARGAPNFSRVYTSSQLPGLILRLHLDNRVHGWISTERQ